MKKILTLLIVVIVVLQASLPMGIILQFHANRQYYAEVLCINKNRPELACKGQCVLMKRLQKEFDQQNAHQSKTLQDLLDREITLFIQSFDINIVRQSSSVLSTKTLITFVKTVVSSPNNSSIFHPPSYQA